MINFTLNNGQQVQSLCFGPGMLTRGLKYHTTFLGKIVDKIEYKRKEYSFYNAICSAIDAGYRFIDYSAAYGREDLIGKAIKRSCIKRNEFILTTRITNKAQFDGNIKESVYRSIDKFGTDYIDLLMFHWPVAGKFVETWKQMIELRNEGICKSLGVSNCHQHHIDLLISEMGETPSINQIEIHPLFTQKPLIEYSRQKGIICEAYTPLARLDERLIRLPLMKNLSLKYGKTITQLILRWHIQNGVIPVFRSLNDVRQKENINIFDFEISEEDMKKIDSMNINSRLRYDPDNCDFTIL